MLAELPKPRRAGFRGGAAAEHGPVVGVGGALWHDQDRKDENTRPLHERHQEPPFSEALVRYSGYAMANSRRRVDMYRTPFAALGVM